MAKRPSLRRGTGCVPLHASHRSTPVSLSSSIPMRRSQVDSTFSLLLLARAEAYPGLDRDREGVVLVEHRDLAAPVLIVAAASLGPLAREPSEAMEPRRPVGEMTPKGD